MIIIGAKGFAKEVLEVLHQLHVDAADICFFDDISTDIGDTLYGQYAIIRNVDSEINQTAFILGIGGTLLREKMFNKFTAAGFKPHTLISPHARIGHFNTIIGDGATIMTGAVLTNDIIIGKGTLINLNATIGHDSIIGNFCDIMPGVHISGSVRIGDFSSIGTGSVILPKITIGHHVTIGAGAVVIKDVPDNTTVTGVPAKPLIR